MRRRNVSSLNLKEQKAYWVNRRNALTIKVIVDPYPVKGIMDIDISPGWFSNGPWDAKLLTIEGEKVNLNDTLQPIFQDSRAALRIELRESGLPKPAAGSRHRRQL